MSPWLWVVRGRNAYYERFGPRFSLNAPTISVGNLAFGGRGKTPFVRLLIAQLRALGRKPAVLSRGYGRSCYQAPVIVEPWTSVALAGDEPLMLKRGDAELIVVTDPNRARGGQVALELGADILVLDDGFQHRQLRRDLDIVLYTELDMKGKCPPFGGLREPWSAVTRAGVRVLVSETMEVQSPEFDLLIYPRLRAVDEQSADQLAGTRCALLAAIARPDRFHRMMSELGVEVLATCFLRDHQEIFQHHIERLRCRVPQATIITTEKDAARLPVSPHELGLRVAYLEQKIISGEQIFKQQLIQTLEAFGA